MATLLQFKNVTTDLFQKRTLQEVSEGLMLCFINSQNFQPYVQENKKGNNLSEFDRICSLLINQIRLKAFDLTHGYKEQEKYQDLAADFFQNLIDNFISVSVSDDGYVRLILNHQKYLLEDLQKLSHDIDPDRFPCPLPADMIRKQKPPLLLIKVGTPS